MEKEEIMKGISAMIDHTVETTGLSYDYISALIVNALNLACSYAPAMAERVVEKAKGESVETIPWEDPELPPGERSGPHDLVEDGGLVVVHGRLRLLQLLLRESVLRVGPDAEQEIYGLQDGVRNAIRVVRYVECHGHAMDLRD